MDAGPSMPTVPHHPPVLPNPEAAPRGICSITFAGTEVRPVWILLLALLEDEGVTFTFFQSSDHCDLRRQIKALPSAPSNPPHLVPRTPVCPAGLGTRNCR